MEEVKVTIGEVSRQWLDMKKLVVKRSTYAKYESIVKNHILPELGCVELAEVNSGLINAFTTRKLYGTEKAPSDWHRKPCGISIRF